MCSGYWVAEITRYPAHAAEDGVNVIPIYIIYIVTGSSNESVGNLGAEKMGTHAYIWPSISYVYHVTVGWVYARVRAVYIT